MSGSKSARDRVAPHVAALPRSGIRDFFELVSAMDDVLSLGVGEPDFVTPWTIREATIYAIERGHTSYTSNLGLRSLRGAICEYVETQFGVRYDPDSECLVTVGVSEALDLILRAVVCPGDEVLYHEPCYVSYAPTVSMLHGCPVPVTTAAADDFRLDPEQVAARVSPRTAALLLNFPNNPTGAALRPTDKAALARLAVDDDLLVISDEIYSELTYGESSPSIAALPGMRDRTVLLAGFSKAYAMTGYRIGYACGPAPLIAAMMKIHQYTMLCAPIMAQEAALEALRRGRRAMLEMREQYEQRRNVIVNRLNAMGLPCRLPEGAFYAYPDISPSGLPATEFATRLLQEENVAVVPGTAFAHGPEAERHVRCAYAAGIETIEEAMTRMAAFVERVRCDEPAVVAAG